jgi:hypothetical protein
MLIQNAKGNGVILIFLCAILLSGSLVFGAGSPENDMVEIQIQTNTETMYTTYDFVAWTGEKK